jgi:hypothetical protein
MPCFVYACTALLAMHNSQQLVDSLMFLASCMLATSCFVAEEMRTRCAHVIIATPRCQGCVREDRPAASNLQQCCDITSRACDCAAAAAG